MDTICVVITGIINTNINEILKTYKDFNNKIISTWNNQSEEFIKILEENNFIIVLSDFLNSYNSTNYQMKSSHVGCLKAKELGFNYVIRMRTDINCNNFPLFVSLLYDNDYFNTNKLISFSGMKFHGNADESNVCIMDNMIGGYINNIIHFYNNLQDVGDVRFPEQYLQEVYLQKNLPTKEDILKHFIFCYDICKKNGLTFFIGKQYNWEFINWRCQQKDAWR